MLNIPPSGLGSTVAVVLVTVNFVDPVCPTLGSKLAAIDGTFADGGGGGDAL